MCLIYLEGRLLIFSLLHVQRLCPLGRRPKVRNLLLDATEPELVVGCRYSQVRQTASYRPVSGWHDCQSLAADRVEVQGVEPSSRLLIVTRITLWRISLPRHWPRIVDSIPALVPGQLLAGTLAGAQAEPVRGSFAAGQSFIMFKPIVHNLLEIVTAADVRSNARRRHLVVVLASAAANRSGGCSGPLMAGRGPTPGHLF